MSKRVVIQCATPPEFDALKKAAGDRTVQREGKRSYFWATEEVAVLKGSVGKVWAAASAEFAIGFFKPGLVVDFGAAGALAEELEIGDLVLAEKVVEHDVRAARPIDLFVKAVHADLAPKYPQKKREKTAITRGIVAAGDQDIQTLKDRRLLAEKHGAIAASWESSAIGRVCEFHGVPYASLRVITDVGGAGNEFLAEYMTNAKRVLEPAANELLALIKGLIASDAV